MSWETDLLEGIAADLDTAGAGTYDATGTTGNIVLGALPDEIDLGVGINSYRIGADDPANPTAKVNVQFWIRGLTLADVIDLDGQIYARYQGAEDLDFGTCHVTQAITKSSMPMGIDGRDRLERSSNYTFDVDLPATGNRSY